MFIDYIPLMLLNMATGLFILAGYLYKGMNSKDQKKWVPGFAITGFIALTNGYHMTWTWPLPGSYNVAFGEMSILFGILFLGAALALAREWDLTIVAVYAFFAGLTAALIGIRIINLGLSRSPVFSGIGFILTGLCGVFSGLVLYLRNNRILRFIGIIVLLAAATIWLRTGLMAYWGHLETLSKWVPQTMQVLQQ